MHIKPFKQSRVPGPRDRGRPRAAAMLAAAVAGVAFMASAHGARVPSLADPALWGSLPDSLARVVYFREEINDPGQPAARIYIDGRLHTSLAGGAASVFCVPTGAYALRSQENPSLGLKSQPGAIHVLAGGSTYYFKVGGNQGAVGASGAMPEISNASQAAGALARAGGEAQLLSRAAIVACPAR